MVRILRLSIFILLAAAASTAAQPRAIAITGDTATENGLDTGSSRSLTVP